MKTNKSKVRIKWDGENEKDSEERLLPSKFNKPKTEGGWRMEVGRYKVLSNSNNN